MVEFGGDDLMPHFIFCKNDSWVTDFWKLKVLFSTTMAKYQMPTSLLTMLHMCRIGLRTKEFYTRVFKGKFNKLQYPPHYGVSINDDLELFLNNIHSKKQLKDEDNYLHFIPKLATEKLKLVESCYIDHMETYEDHYPSYNADVREIDMKKSDSEDKYVYCSCRRKTVLLNTVVGRLEPLPWKPMGYLCKKIL